MKKVLIICYYWPPAGGPGVQRWLKFVKYLRDFGIEPVVYVPENPHYPILDASMLEEVPEGIEVIRYPIREPYSLAGIFSKKQTRDISSGIIDNPSGQNWLQKLMLFIRGNFFVPDARKYWIKPSVRFLENYLETHSTDLIITSGPPHSLHLIGLSLKAKTGIGWLADFRDPWTSIGYHRKLKLMPSAKRKHKELERKVLNSADHIVVTSPRTKQEFEQLTGKPVSCITNGFDEEKIPEVSTDEKFSLAHIGSLLADRNPLVLWETLRELKEDLSGFSADFKLMLAGKVSNAVLNTLDTYGLTENLDYQGYISHEKALKAQQKAQVLLIIEINSEDTKAIIPGKVFEYLAAKRPVLGIGPENSDFFSIVKGAGAGKCFGYLEKDDLKNYIINLYEQYEAGGIPVNSNDVSAYSRKNLTSDLADIINKLTS